MKIISTTITTTSAKRVVMPASACAVAGAGSPAAVRRRFEGGVSFVEPTYVPSRLAARNADGVNHALGARAWRPPVT